MTREKELYSQWLENVGDIADYRAELEAAGNDEAEVKDRFYRELEFGTAGLRGVLGLGTNRMNVYTVRRVTQAFSEYLKGENKSPSAAIAYDSRINSDLFARETARVFAANGVKVWLYPELMPTPALSYAVRELKCDAGVVVTASHNPAKYNGYKAYGNDGCQLGLVGAGRIQELSAGVDFFTGVKEADFDDMLKSGMIEFIPGEFTQKYIDRVYEEAINPEAAVKADLRLVYTPLNGAGKYCVMSILSKLGVTDIHIVKEQENPDGNFPTCPYPNPEIDETLTLGLKLCVETDADMLLATDPDCDRVAVAVKDNGSYRILNGNETGVILLDYVAKARTARGTMPERPVTIKSIVSTKLTDAVAAEYGVEVTDVLTGFKFIGEAIFNLEQKGEVDRFIFGFEESCGYLSGPFVRDKDAVNASLLLVEAASAYKLEGKTLCDALDEIHEKHGFYLNHVDNFAFEGADGMKRMEGIMDTLRESPPAVISGVKVIYFTDYLNSVKSTDGIIMSINLPKSNVLEYGLENGCTVIARPSGTEPKLKTYYSLVAKTRAEAELLRDEYTRAFEMLTGLR